MTGFVDIHSHLVYGMDDGAKTSAEMKEMLDAAYADGIKVIFATPHVELGITPFDEGTFLRRLEEAQVYCDTKGYGIQLYPGAGILYSPFFENYIRQRRIPTLSDTAFILLEFSPSISFDDLEAAVSSVERGGYIPILAHIERYRCLRSGRRAWQLKRRHNVRYQINADSILEPCGVFFKYIMGSWIKNGLIDYVASDSHNSVACSYRMKTAHHVLEHRYGEQLASIMTGKYCQQKGSL